MEVDIDTTVKNPSFFFQFSQAIRRIKLNEIYSYVFSSYIHLYLFCSLEQTNVNSVIITNSCEVCVLCP